MSYGTCTECGYEAPTFEDARLHSRDKHGGIRSGMMGIFDKGEDDV